MFIFVFVFLLLFLGLCFLIHIDNRQSIIEEVEEVEEEEEEEEEEEAEEEIEGRQPCWVTTTKHNQDRRIKNAKTDSETYLSRSSQPGGSISSLGAMKGGGGGALCENCQY